MYNNDKVLPTNKFKEIHNLKIFLSGKITNLSIIYAKEILDLQFNIKRRTRLKYRKFFRLLTSSFKLFL